ncbi:MAG TPA: pantoate--beta-alanine ligase, partial [Clostridia bacterium]|nr:pantoate--beta-alanine ligase [Clostridia bacterium]
LAMSSRNKYLTGDLRRQALVLADCLRQIRERVHGAAGPVPAAQLRKVAQKAISQQPAAQLDYIEFFDPLTLVPSSRVGKGSHVALAVFVGKTRLIDNIRI